MDGTATAQRSTEPSRATIGRSLRIGLALTVGLVGAMGAGDCDDIQPPCQCYFSTDCPAGQKCMYNFLGAECSNSGKNDGICQSLTGGIPPGDIPETDTPSAMQMFDRAFLAYEAPIANGGGRPDPDLWNSIDELASSPEQADAVRIATHAALEITLGWDFNLAVHGEPAGEGNIRLASHPVAMKAMLKATRLAVRQAIEQKDATAVAGPILTFWQQHPDFHPDHLGRCYPHGHETEFESAADCQIDELTIGMQWVLENTTFRD